MIAPLRNSSSLVKSSTQKSFDCSSDYYWTQKDLCSTSVGNIALELDISENDMCPVSQLRIVHRVHKIDDNSFIDFPG
jgi:hypothetical protein